MSIAEPIIEAFASVFTAFGINAGLAEVISTLAIVVILFFVFLNIISGFGIDTKTKGYLFLIFFVGLVLLGFVPPWILVIIVILGITLVFYTQFFNQGSGS